MAETDKIIAGIFIQKPDLEQDDFGYFHLDHLPRVGQEITLVNSGKRYEVLSVEEYDTDESTSQEEATVKIHVREK